MLKIGDFSKLSRVSIRMLRYYDEVGLIKPVKVDDFTGYRYYSETQLSLMGKINALKDMGFGVAAISEIVKCKDDPVKMEQILAIRKAELLEESEEIAKRLQLLDTAIHRLRKDENMKYNCVLKQLPERYVASVRKVIPKYDHEGELWHILFSETKDMNLIPIGLNSAIMHDKEYKESDVDVEVQVEVKGTYNDTEHVKFKTESEQSVASVTFNGSYEQFPEVYSSLASWVNENGYEFSGSMIDIYHVSPHETQNPEEFVTEVCCPVKKR